MARFLLFCGVGMDQVVAASNLKKQRRFLSFSLATTLVLSTTFNVFSNNVCCVSDAKPSSPCIIALVVLGAPRQHEWNPSCDLRHQLLHYIDACDLNRHSARLSATRTACLFGGLTQAKTFLQWYMWKLVLSLTLSTVQLLSISLSNVMRMQLAAGNTLTQ